MRTILQNAACLLPLLQLLHLLLLLQLLQHASAEGNTTNWHCNFTQSEIPTQKEVVQTMLTEYAKNPDMNFYPRISVYREMSHNMDCLDDPELVRSAALKESLPDAGEPALWPGGNIPFTIDPSYAPDTAQRLRDALNAFNGASCVKFNERVNEDVYIRFISPNTTLEPLPVYDDSGNSTGAGKEFLEGKDPGYSGTIVDFLRTDADVKKGSSGVMQTLMYVLGIRREENRYDRDNFIQLEVTEEDPMKRRIFQKNRVTKLDLEFPYDTQSAAHITSHDAEILRVGLKPKDPSANPIKPSADNVLSPGDIKKINFLYCPGGAAPDGDSTDTPPSETEEPVPMAVLQPSDIEDLLKSSMSEGGNATFAEDVTESTTMADDEVTSEGDLVDDVDMGESGVGTLAASSLLVGVCALLRTLA
ncbi:zinc metalloproteinase nas-14 [Hyalella azteca]|uniref:Metalloendopeptidase n=1 Tax=Hyalella azteca TaxID=294128 RepID=A0A8B7PHD3_HYAAZ|nr:zinc metalloproteinase nas-14 [Hyalella azteca]